MKILLITTAAVLLLGSCQFPETTESKPAILKNLPMNQPSQWLKLVKHQVTDYQGTGQTAMTFLLPENWTVDDSLYWLNTDATMPVRYAATYTSPDQLMKMETYPDYRFIYTKGPMGAQGAEPPGSVLKGLEQIIMALRKGAGYQITEKKLIPDMDPPANMTGGVRGQVHKERGMIKFEFEKDGQLMEQEIFGVYQTITSTSQGVVYLETIGWNLSDLFSIMAPKGKLQECQKVALTVRASFKMTLEFFNRVMQVYQLMQDQYYNEIAAAGQISRIISATNDQMLEGIDAQYKAANASADRINQQFSDYLRGVDRYRDGTSEIVLPSGYNEAWQNSKGEYLLSNTVGFDPSVSLGDDWKKLHRE